MLRRLIPLLLCPWCGSEGLTLTGGSVGSERVTDGELGCVTCGKATRVTDGVWLAMGPHHRQRSIAQLTNVWPNALFYESLWRPGSLSRFSGRKFPLSEELGELCAALQPAPHKVFVDVACSEGLYARTLAGNGAAVFAVEHSVAMLRKVVRRSGDLPVVAVQAVAQHMPLRSGSLDGAAVGGSMNEIGDRLGAVAEMARVIRPPRTRNAREHSSAAGDNPDGVVFSMHLNRAKTGPGRVLQRSLASSGIVFDTPEGWRRDFAAGGLSIESEHTDAIVSRMTLRPAAGVS